MNSRDPKHCGESMNFQGVYICMLESVPCFAMEKCAKEKMIEFIEGMIRVGEKPNEHDNR